MDNIKLEYSLFKKDLSKIDEETKVNLEKELEALFNKYNFLLAGKMELLNSPKRTNVYEKNYNKIGIYDGSLVLLGNDEKPLKGQYSLILEDVVDLDAVAKVELLVDVSDIKQVKY